MVVSYRRHGARPLGTTLSSPPASTAAVPDGAALRTRSPGGGHEPVASVPDDLQLLAAFVAGDPLAFHTLLQRHHGRVYAICYRYFGDRADAEDATQETFIALVRHAATVRGTAKLSTWLHRVAINSCHDIARRRARRPRPSHQDMPDVAEPFDRLTYRETELDLQAALARLDATSRAALILVAIDDHTYAEAAEIVGMSVAAMKSCIHRARAQLAGILAEGFAASAGCANPTGTA